MKKYSFTDIYNLQKQANEALTANEFYKKYVAPKGVSYDGFKKKFLAKNKHIDEGSFQSVKFHPSKMLKGAAAMLTPQAQAAAMPPSVPPMPPQGVPMDPAMMQGGMPPVDPAAIGGAPMDPSMMGDAPAGDPAAMGGAPMDPAMAGGMSPPGAWMQDPMFAEFLMSIGFQQGPDGNFIDPNGQPVPPQMMDQIYMQYLMQMQSGGMPPADHAAMGDMPPEAQMPPAELPPEIMEQISSMVQDIISSELEQRFSTTDKKITAFNQKLDTIKTLLDDLLIGGAKQSNEKAQEDSVNAQLERQLKASQQTEAQPIQPTEQMLTQKPLGNMLDIMRG